MNFNKCERCGCFFASNNSTCPACTTKDNKDIFALNNYFSENNRAISINDLSNITGISKKNLSRFAVNDNFDYRAQIKL